MTEAKIDQTNIDCKRNNVEKRFITDYPISAHAKLIYLILYPFFLKYDGKANPTIDFLVKKSSLSFSTVKRAINELVKKGFIKKKRGHQAINHYFQVPCSEWPENEDKNTAMQTGQIDLKETTRTGHTDLFEQVKQTPPPPPNRSHRPVNNIRSNNNLNNINLNTSQSWSSQIERISKEFPNQYGEDIEIISAFFKAYLFKGQCVKHPYPMVKTDIKSTRQLVLNNFWDFKEKRKTTKILVSPKPDSREKIRDPQMIKDLLAQYQNLPLN